MDMRAALLQDRSKGNIQRIADHVGDHPERFAQLMVLVLNGTSRMQQLTSWVMTVACEAHPQLAEGWVPQFLDLLEKPLHQGVHRNVLRCMQHCPLPVSHHGRITDKMFALILDPGQAIATRAFAITVAMRMVVAYPELAGEMRITLEEVLRMDPGPAVRSRATKAIRTMDRTNPGLDRYSR